MIGYIPLPLRVSDILDILIILEIKSVNFAILQLNQNLKTLLVIVKNMSNVFSFYLLFPSVQFFYGHSFVLWY